MDRIPKVPFLAGFIIPRLLGMGFEVVGLVLGFQSIMDPDPKTEAMADVLSWVGLLFSLGGFIVTLVLLYRLWSELPPRVARTSPGKAVWFHFIPFYNLYWVFQAWYGWARDFNRVAERRSPTVPRMSEPVALATSIFMLLSGIVGFGLVHLVLTTLFMSSAIDCANGLRADRERDFEDDDASEE